MIPSPSSIAQKQVEKSAGAACGPNVPSALQVVPDQSDQVPRLQRFRAAHPGVAIMAGHGCWQARVQAASKETVIFRYTLRELLDKLDELTRPQPDQSTG